MKMAYGTTAVPILMKSYQLVKSLGWGEGGGGKRRWYSTCVFSNEAQTAGVEVQWKHTWIAYARLCACRRKNGVQKGITYLSFRVSANVNRLNMAQWIKTGFCFNFYKGHPVVLILTVYKIYLLPSDTTYNIVYCITYMGDWFRSAKTIFRPFT